MEKCLLMFQDYHLQLSSADLTALTKKCPNLKSISDADDFGNKGLLRLSDWPTSHSCSGASLERLHMRHTYFPPDMFKDIQGPGAFVYTLPCLQSCKLQNIRESYRSVCLF